MTQDPKEPMAAAEPVTKPEIPLETVAHTGQSVDPTVLDLPAVEAGDTLRNAVAKGDLDPTQTPDSVAPITRTEKSHKKRLLIGTAAAALIATAASVFALSGGDSDSSKKVSAAPSATAAEPSTPSSTPEATSINGYEAHPEVQIPNSDDPATLAHQLMSNYANYLNTGDERFLALWAPDDVNLEVANKARERRREIAAYQAQSNSTYHLTYPKEDIIVVNDQTVFPTDDTSRTLVFDNNQEEYLDKRAVTPQSNTWTRDNFRLGKFNRTIQKTDGTTVTEDVWLPIDIQDLGTPPTTSSGS